MKKWTVLPAAALGGIIVLNLAALCAREKPAAAPPAIGPVTPLVLAAGPGRVEPISEEISVSAQVSGRLQDVFVEEGDRIAQGQVIAVINNVEHLARVRSAEAERPSVDEGQPAALVCVSDEADETADAMCGKCGDGYCNPRCGETATSCPKDCGGTTS